jgi:methyl-accepting chemotaxis protein
MRTITRLLLGFSLVIGLELVQGGIGLLSIDKLGTDTNDASARPLAIIDAAKSALDTFHDAERQLADITQATRFEDTRQSLNRFAGVSEKIDIRLAELDKLRNGSDSMDAVKDVIAAIKEWSRDARILLGETPAAAIPAPYIMDKLASGIGKGLDRLVAGAYADAETSRTRLQLAIASARVWSIVLMGACFLGAIVIALISARSITRPMGQLERSLAVIADGDLDNPITLVTRKDEIGRIALIVEKFRNSLLEARAASDVASQTEAKNVESMKRTRNQIADQFQAKMGILASGLAKSSSEVLGAAKNLSATAEETLRQAQAVSGSAEDASTNVQTVAASTEEMTASIREIAGQVAKSSDIANLAATEASRSESDVKALSEAAAKIGEVVDLINNIAGQTNLLALNATIEAARAGEAGRGFAVVASEVKQLASQTARATEEIRTKIEEIQSATNRTVGSIDNIVRTIGDIRQISTVIASAIEEQGAATRDISSNTHLAARGTEDVTNNINGVSRAAEMTGAASTQLMGLSGNLSTQATELQYEVADFVKQLRAG